MNNELKELLETYFVSENDSKQKEIDKLIEDFCYQMWLVDSSRFDVEFENKICDVVLNAKSED